MCGSERATRAALGYRGNASCATITRGNKKNTVSRLRNAALRKQNIFSTVSDDFFMIYNDVRKVTVMFDEISRGILLY